ncbi:MAG: hypothetical protein L6V93_05900 [Clostridiales bacterium]|nr:MAG: hypothetical protein L6V93_05900 [Clostridiales bacterium]
MGFMSESEYSKKLISQLNSEKIPESFYISGKGADGYEIEKLYYTYIFDKLSGDVVLIEADYKKLFFAVFGTSAQCQRQACDI